MSPERSFTRQMLEDSWLRRLEETQARYHEAQDRYRKLLQEQPNGTQHDPNGAVALVLHAETEALAEYTRVLRAFTDLTINGKIPKDNGTIPQDRLRAVSDGV